MTNREKGKKLEDFISAYLKDIDLTARPTKASGASTELGDILNSKFFCECKYRETDNVTINRKVWKKLLYEIPVGSLKIPLYILQNKHKETFMVLDIKDFIRLITEKNELRR
jgi:hypothetical protein